MSDFYRSRFPALGPHIGAWPRIRLADLDLVASPQAWQALEHYVGASLRTALTSTVQRLRRCARRVRAGPGCTHTGPAGRVAAAPRRDPGTCISVQKTTVDFYAQLPGNAIRAAAGGAPSRLRSHRNAEHGDRAHTLRTAGTCGSHLCRGRTRSQRYQGRTPVTRRDRRESGSDDQSYATQSASLLLDHS